MVAIMDVFLHLVLLRITHGNIIVSFYTFLKLFLKIKSSLYNAKFFRRYYKVM